MTSGLTTASIGWALERFKQKIDVSADELNELDGALGDGDLGVTMTRAVGRLAEDAPKLPDDVGLALLQCAQIFGRVSAATYGTLLSTGLMAAAKLTRGRQVIPWSESPSLLGAALKAMADRGKGRLGDKTVLDAIEAARQAIEGIVEPAAMVDAVNRAVASAIEQFRELPFRQGRARIFGSKGIGRDDPGMIAFKRLVESLEH
jgi:phosphoenolpyruvate---glycerone phosphotransferase subunit DhaL